jgi:DinB superfamily
MSNPILEAGLTVLAFSRQSLLTLAEDFPKDKLTHQPFPGANHALWLMGHLANADDFFMAELGKKPMPQFEKTKALFFMGSKPTPNVKDYPPIEEIRSYLSSAREGLVSWFKSMPPTQLAAPLPEDWKPFAPTYGALMFSIAWHEGLHTGQLTTLRKSLGLSPKFG